jgi:hypothetical protein
MILRRILVTAVFAAAFLVVTGCASLSGSFVDTSSLPVSLTNVRLENGKELAVRFGGQIWRIPLSRIKRMTLYSYESTTIDRRLFFLGAIELKDGSVLASNRNTETGGTTFIAVDDAITGNHDKSKVRIPLDKIAKMSFK